MKKIMKIKNPAQFLYDEEGNKTKVILHASTFEKLMEELENIKILQKVEARKKQKSNKKLIPLEVIKRELHGENKKLS